MKISIGFLTGSISRSAGGLYESVRYLAKSLNLIEDVDLKVIGLRDQHSVTDINAWHPISVNLVDSIPMWGFHYAPQLTKIINSSVIDLLHIHGIWLYTSVASNKWAKVTSKPYLISPRGMLDRWALKNNNVKKLISKWLYEGHHLRNANCLHALCESEVKAIREFGLTNPVAIIPNGVTIPSKGILPKPNWGKNLPPDSKILFYIGRIHPKKGLSEFIKSWQVSRSLNSKIAEKWYFVIAGWDQLGHEEYLKNLVKSYNLESSVIFVGPQYGEEKSSSFQFSDAFVLPSYSEGLPVAILEAWSFQLPVLMTPFCNLPEGVRYNAAISELPNLNSMSNALTRLFKMNDNDLKLMGINGRELVKEKFNWQKIALDMKRVYEWILKGRNPPDCVRF